MQRIYSYELEWSELESQFTAAANLKAAAKKPLKSIRSGPQSVDLKIGEKTHMVEMNREKRIGGGELWDL